MQLDLAFPEPAEGQFRRQRAASGAALLTGVEAMRVLSWSTVACRLLLEEGDRLQEGLLALLGALSSLLVALAAPSAVRDQ